MGDVLVRAATMSGDQIGTLVVRLHGLPERTIDRETALAWMRDGHSLIPFDGRRHPALLLVEVDDVHYVRADSTPSPSDTLPDVLRAS